MPRRQFLLAIVLTCAFCSLVGAVFQSQSPPNPITRDIIATAGKLIGLDFSDAKRDSMRDGLKDQMESYTKIRKVHLSNDVPPSISFNPIPNGMKIDSTRKPFRTSPVGAVALPANIEDVAFYSVGQLAELLKTRKLTSLQLTRMYLNRLKKYGPRLECVITLTEELALAQAKRADEEIAAGKYRGVLHGIPYGAKDLLSTKGIKTTWGSVP